MSKGIAMPHAIETPPTFFTLNHHEMKKLLSTIVFTLIVLFGNSQSQRFLWFNELYPDPGANENEYIEFFNTSPLTIFLDCYVVLSYFDNGTEKGVYVYNFPSNSQIQGFSYYLISSNNVVRHKDGTFSPPPNSVNFSNWNNPGSGGYISKYTYSNNQWSGPSIVTGNFNDFMQITSGNDASLLLYKINSDGTTSLVNGFFANSSLSVPTKITSLTAPLSIPPGSICANSFPLVSINFTGITTNNVDIFQVQSAAGNNNGYAKLSNGLCGNWEKTSAKNKNLFTPGEANTIGGATSVLTTTQSYTCNTVSFSLTPESSTTYPIIVQLFYDNPTTSVFAENDVLNGSYSINSAASASSTFNVPNKQPVFLIYQTSSGCFAKISALTSSCSVLPVHFQSFSATRNPQRKEQVLLKWQTATEQNNRGFNVQRKVDGQWKNIAFVFSQAENGNSNTILSYEFKDNNLSNSVTQYQIQQVDFDGKSSFSEVKSVVGLEQKSGVIIYPNPAIDGKIKLLFNEQDHIKEIIVSDMNGRVVKQYRQFIDNNLTIEGLKAGFYTIKIIDRSTSQTSVEKVIIK